MTETNATTTNDGLPHVPPAPDKPTPPVLAFRDLIDRLADDAGARWQAKQDDKPFGAITGLPTLDKTLGGALAPGLHIIHGSPGVGKTAFALQVGSSCGCPCLYVTCEMTPLELLRRHSARITNTFLGKFKSGELTRDEARIKALQGAKAAPFFALMDATETPATPTDVLTAAEAVRGLDTSGHLLIVVDSLHSWADAIDSEIPEYDRLNAGLGSLRFLSKRLDCAVAVISERNRTAMKSSGQNSGAGTRKIEYGAESIIALDAEEQEGADGAKAVTATISKNRSGSAGDKIALRFFGALQKYTDEKAGNGGNDPW